MKVLKVLVCGLIILALCPFITATAIAQVVSPPLDPTEGVIIPAAAGWRESTAVGISYHEGNGTRALDDNQTYQFDANGSSINATFQAGNFFIDGFYDDLKTNVKMDQYYDDSVILQMTDSRLNIALKGNDFVTIGLGGRSAVSRIGFDSSSDAETRAKIKTIGSISIKFQDIFYFGGGFERVREECSYEVDNSWNNIVSGVAIVLGDPGDSRFRMEYSFAYSPENVNQAQGTLTGNSHPKTLTSRLAVDITFNGLLFSLKGTDVRKDVEYSGPVGQSFDEITIIKTQTGVLWVPQEGLILGFYFLSDKTVRNYEDDNSEFRINIGYLF